MLAYGMCYVVTFLNIDWSLSPLQAYRSSMLKAFTRTLDEGNFTIVIGMGFSFDISMSYWKDALLFFLLCSAHFNGLGSVELFFSRSQMMGYMLKVLYLFGEIVSFTVFRLSMFVFDFLNMLLVVAPGRRNYAPSQCGLTWTLWTIA